MQLLTQPTTTTNNAAWNNAAQAFATDLTNNYDAYAQEVPVYLQLKQLAKITALVKWIHDSGIASDMSWANDYKPAFVATPRTLPRLNNSTTVNGRSYGITGGVIYSTPNTYNADDGSATSLKNASQTVSTNAADTNWTFTKDGQQYKAVAVSAKAFRSMGAFSTQETDFSIPVAKDLAVNVTRSYSSFNQTQYGLGRGWDYAPARFIDLSPTTHVFCNGIFHETRIGITLRDGTYETFTFKDCVFGYFPDRPTNKIVVHNESGGWFRFILPDDTELITDASPQHNVYRIKNRNGTYTNLPAKLSPSPYGFTTWDDDNGRKLTPAYNAQNLVSSITDWLGRTVSYSYDGNGNLINVTDPNGKITTYTYDSSNRLTKITNKVGQTIVQNTYNSENKVTTQIDNSGLTTSFNYDDTARQITQSDTLGRVNKVLYDAETRIIKETDALGNYIQYSYAANSMLPSSVADKKNNITTYTYDSRGNIASVTDPNGKTITNSYSNDDYTNLLKVLDGRYNPAKQTTFTYDSKGNLLEKKEDTLSTKNTYDSKGNILTITDALNKTHTYTRDNFGNVLTLTDPNNNVTTNTYDAIGRLTKTVDPDGKIVSFSYDNTNNILTKTEGNNTISYVYDAQGRVQKSTAPNGAVTEFTYNPNATLTSVKDPSLSTHSYGYDQYKNLITKQDALNRTTQYTYDSLDRKTKTTMPVGSVLKWEYDQNGNLTKRIDGKNNTTTYAYDKLNRLITITYPDTKIISYTYDDRSNLTRMVDPSGTTTFTYDIYDRLTKVTNPYNQAVAYAYDSLHHLNSLTYPDQKTVSYSYGSKNELLSATDWNNQQTTYTYNKNGLIATRTLPNGIKSTYAYDNANRLISLLHAKGTNTLASYTYERDSLGNITKATEEDNFPVISTTPTPTATATPTPTGTPQTNSLLSIGKPIVASTQKSGYEATKANDGVVIGSYWEAQTNLFPSTLTIDLGSNYSVNKIVMKLDWGTRTENVEILGSVDNTNFTTIVPAANYAIGTVPVTFTSTNTRYVRLKINSNSGFNAAQMAEFEVWGTNPLNTPTPTPTAISIPTQTPTPTATPTQTSGYSAQYFNNINLSGTPTLTRTDAAINFNWGGGSPASGINVDNFSVRWTKTDTFAAGAYTFSMTGDDGVRLYIDNVLVIDKWILQGPTTYTHTQSLSAGNHTIKMEYFESGGGAEARLSYQSTLTTPTPTVTPTRTPTPNVPTSTPTPTPTIVPTTGPTTGTQLLSTPWNLVGNNGASEKYQSINSNALMGMDTVRITYNLHGIQAIGGDASAIIFDQNGWKLISLSNYGQNGLNGSQTVEIPLSHFGLNLTQPVGTLHTRFWYGSPFTVDITSITVFKKNTASISTPTVKSFMSFISRLFSISQVEAAAAPAISTFTYDQLGRLTGAVYPDSNYSFQFNGVDNRISQTVGGITTSYTYDSDNRLTQFGNMAYGYDANDDLITKTSPQSNQSITYNFEGKPTSITSNGVTTQYTYDGHGNRLEKKTGTTVTRLVNDLATGLPVILAETNSANVIQNYNVYGREAISKGGAASTSRHYYLEDGMGNIRFVTNSNGDKVMGYNYDPYGSIRNTNGSSDNTLQFKAEPYESDHGLYYMRARFYDPTIGRFISRDPFEGTLNNPQSQNGFAFAYNNPLNLSDPSGACVEDACIIEAATVCATAACKDGDCTNEVRAGYTVAQLTAQRAPGVIQGVYQFMTTNGQLYIGRSVDVLRRLGQHINSGKLPVQNYEQVVISPQTGIQSQRILEQTLINNSGGISALENQINSVSPTYWQTLGIPGVVK
jgi:RHS repeat-associated protein